MQLACETDFVARTDRFRDGLSAVLQAIHGDEAIAISLDKASDAAFLENLCAEHHLRESLDPDEQRQTIGAGIKYTGSKTQENC